MRTVTVRLHVHSDDPRQGVFQLPSVRVTNTADAIRQGARTILVGYRSVRSFDPLDRVEILIRGADPATAIILTVAEILHTKESSNLSGR